MKNLFLCLCLTLLFSFAHTADANAQGSEKVALVPSVTGYDTGKNNVLVSDFAIFNEHKIQIQKSDFVSPSFLPELYPSWILDWGEVIGLFTLSDVYRGEDVYQAWIDTLNYGVICQASKQDAMPFLSTNGNTETCAYTSREENSEGEPSVFYCVFWRANGIDSERQCEIVAQTTTGGEKVLAVAEGHLPTRGAGGEAFWYCVFPDVPPNEAATKISELMSLLTEDKGVSFVNNIGDRHLVGAQAMNLSSYHDQYFVKLSVMGDLTDLKKADASYASSSQTGFDPSDVENLGPGSMFAYYRSFTVSPRVSTSVIDYREPSSAIEEQIFKAYGEKVEKFYSEHFPGYECQFFLI